MPTVDATQSATQTATATPSSSGAKPAIDKDAFLKLLVAQLSHQDPLNPMQGTEFVTQLSQFSIVEQAVAQSKQLELLSTQVTGLSNNEATALVGKSVTVRGHGIAFDGVLATGANVTLGGPATKVTASIKDTAGNVVRTLDLGARPAGSVSVQWDGKDDHGNTVPKGSYSLSVTATDANNAPVHVSQDVTGVVTKVSFDKGYPELTLDTGATAAISDLVSVAAPPPRP